MSPSSTLFFAVTFILILSIPLTSTLDDEVVNKWTDIEKGLKNGIRTLLRTIIPQIAAMSADTKVSKNCSAGILKWITSMKHLKGWAIKMLDSSGKFPPSGVMEGTLTDLGRFDECLSINEVLEGDDELVVTRMKGQYCSINIRPPLPPRPRFHTLCNQIPSLVNFSSDSSAFRWLGKNAQYFYYTPIRIGICLPSQCSPQDVNRMVSKFAETFNMTGTVVGMKCDVSGAFNVSRTQLLCILFFIIMFLIIMAGTITDVYGIGENIKFVSSTSNWRQQELEMLSRTDQSIYTPSTNAGLPVGHMFWVSQAVPVGMPTGKGHRTPEQMSSSQTTSSDSDSLTSQVVIDCSQWVKVIKCFSLRRNATLILNLDSEKSESSLPVIHGMRVFTMAWIILGHTYGLVNPQLHSHAFSAQAMYTNFWFQGLLNATLSVDTFFFISGLLTVYVSWKKLSKKKSVPAIPLTFLRYLRLTPPYLAIISLTFVFPLLSSGPVWRETTEPIVEACYESWWTNLLYINNFVQTEKLCLMHSWYLSNDMQMHLFALFFIYLLFKSKMLAFFFLTASMAACTAYSAIQTFVNEYPPTIISTSPAVEDRWKYILDYYYKPWPHLPSYCIGLALGFVLASKSRITLSSGQNRTCWVFITTLSLIVLYGVYPWNMGWNISSEVTAMYSSTFRTLWTTCCAWGTYALLTQNKSSLMAKVMSWKGLLPFSRLTYMAFLIHPFVIWFYSGSMRERFTATHFNYFHLFLAHYLLTYALAFVFGVCFESPFMALLKLLFTPDKSIRTPIKNNNVGNRLRKEPENASEESVSTMIPPPINPSKNKSDTREFIYYHMNPTSVPSYSP